MRVAWQLDADLGEGPVWIAADRALWFVDIKRGHLHRHDPANGQSTTLAMGGAPSFIAAIDGGGLLVGDRDRLMRFADGAYVETLATIPMPAHNRTNDATVDRHGRLWFGTMDDGTILPTGHFWRFDGAVLRQFGAPIAITNGPAVSPDGTLLYTVDTLAGHVRQHRIDADGMIDDGEAFVTLAASEGNPDGVTMDSEGCLWLAVWGGGCVRRYAPDGTLLLELPLPCSHVTKVAFGGPDLRTGFVTTARIDLDEAALAAQPLAGSLFTFDAPAPGHCPPPVRLTR